MPTAYTSQLGLALPVSGDLTGTWGDVVNDSITSLVDSAIAGTVTLSADADVTLTDTQGAANQARSAIIRWTANGTITRNITAPARSKAYIVINATSGTQSIVLRGAGPTTGVTITSGEKALIAWSGTDFVKVSSGSGSGGGSTALTTELFSGTGAQTVFTLSSNPGLETNTQVYVGGLYQQKDTYTVVGTTLTFSEAPPSGTNNIEVVIIQATPVGFTDASSVTFLQAGTGAVPRLVQDKLRETVSATDYGADPTGVIDSSSIINSLLAQGFDVDLVGGTYKANNLTQSASFQRLYSSTGIATIQKNANGPLMTATGNDVEFANVGFRGDAASPTFTGDGVVSSGNNFRMINCGSRWMTGRAVKTTGSHAQIIGTCDIYQTADATASGYDIELGVSGTATLYHQITNIVSTQSTGGILTVDTGSVMVTGSQFGKLTVNAGTSPSGVNGGNYIGNRITGNITVNLSNSAWAGNQVSGSTVTFGAGTSGHMFDTSNTTAVGTTITDSSTASLVVDSKLVSPVSYTPTWTAATANPSLGNGSIQGAYTKTGKRVDVNISLSIGTTTTLGTGIWYFSLPFAPSTVQQWTGGGYCLVAAVAFYVLAPVALTDGTARCIVYSNNSGNSIGPAIPAAWAAGSNIYLSMTYYANS